MDSSPISESDDSMSESTRAFNLQAEKDFAKHFPLRSERKSSMGPPTSVVRGNPTFGKTPHLPISTPHSMRNASTPIRFSLDESFVTGATAQNLSSKVAELTTELDLHKRKLDRQSKELEKATERMEKYKADAEELIRNNAELKKRNGRLEDDLRGVELMGNTESTLNASSSTLINKLFTWMEWKDAQLNTMAAIMASARLWNEENRELVSNSYRSIEPTTLSPDDVVAHASGSVQDFMGIHESTWAEVVEEEEEPNPNETTLRGDNDSVLMEDSAVEEIRTNHSSRILSVGDELDSVLESSSILDNTMHKKDEKIDKLEFELTKAQDQLELYKGRTTRLAVLQEENEQLKYRLKCLDQMHDDSLRDLHASNRLCEEQLACTMTSPDGRRMERDEARSLTHTMRDMQRKMNEWEEAYRNAQKEAEEARRETEGAQNEAQLARDQAAQDRYQLELYANNSQQVVIENNALTAQLDELRAQLERANRVDTAPLVDDTLLAENIPTDAGDNTQIVHFQFNPLQQARQELREEQERKRSMSGDEGPSVKRGRSDEAEIEDLRKKLHNAESRCERLSNLNIESIRTFRNTLLKVTGFDYKMKPDDSLQLVSFLDPLNQHFGFLVQDGMVQMIELPDKPFDGPDRFQQERARWLDGNGSVPGFLAACQLKILEGATGDTEETLMYEGNDMDDLDDPSAGPSFSILRED